jgi:hypothetical protein
MLEAITPAPDNSAREALRALQNELREAQDDLSYWSQVFDDDRWKEFEDSISTQAEPGKTKHLDRFLACEKSVEYTYAKARAIACDDILENLRYRANPDRLAEIQKRIEKFTEENALFLQE